MSQNNDLLQHHIQETRRSFNEIKHDIEQLSDSIQELNDFKIHLLASGKSVSAVVSLIVSGVCGLVTLVLTFLSLKK